MSNKVPCPLCERDMASPKTVSCSQRKGTEFQDGSIYAALQYGSDALQPYVEIAPERCRDCNVMYGGTHHMNCCIETCPKCHGQALSCNTCHPTVVGMIVE